MSLLESGAKGMDAVDITRPDYLIEAKCAALRLLSFKQMRSAFEADASPLMHSPFPLPEGRFAY